MAWEDRTHKEKQQAMRAARKYRATDDDATYVVTTGKGTRITVKGINSAKAVSGKDGTYKKK